MFRFYFIFLKTKFKNLRRKAFELLTNRPHAGERSHAITLPELHDSIKKRPPNEKNLSRYSWASADSVQDSLCFSILLGFFLSSRAVPLPRFKLIGPVSFFFIARHLRQRIYYYYTFGFKFFFKNASFGDAHSSLPTQTHHIHLYLRTQLLSLFAY